jgi:hypothetical protein
MLALHLTPLVDAPASTDDLPKIVTRHPGAHDVHTALARLAEAIVVPAPRSAAIRDRVIAGASTTGRRS